MNAPPSVDTLAEQRSMNPDRVLTMQIPTTSHNERLRWLLVPAAGVTLTLILLLRAAVSGSAMDFSGALTALVFLTVMPSASLIWPWLLASSVGGSHPLEHFGRYTRNAQGAYLAGMVLLVLSALLPASGNVDPYWHLLMGYSAAEVGATVELRAAGILLVAVSMSIAAMRALVMTTLAGPLNRPAPTLVWAIRAQSLATVVGAPIVVATVVLMLLERHASLGLFDPTLGGDPVFFEHLFWMGVHPLLWSSLFTPLGISVAAASMLAHETDVMSSRRGVLLMAALPWCASGWVLHLSAPAPVSLMVSGAVFMTGLAMLSVVFSDWILLVVKRGRLTSPVALATVMMMAPVLLILTRGVVAAVPGLNRASDAWLYGTPGLTALFFVAVMLLLLAVPVVRCAVHIPWVPSGFAPSRRTSAVG